MTKTVGGRAVALENVGWWPNSNGTYHVFWKDTGGTIHPALDLDTPISWHWGALAQKLRAAVRAPRVWEAGDYDDEPDGDEPCHGLHAIQPDD